MIKNTIKLSGIIILLLTAFNAEAQKTGIKGGVNLSNWYVDDVDDENMKVGFHAGLYHQRYLTDNIYIQPELLYSLKGATIHYDNFLGGSGKYKYNFGYVDVPVLAGIEMNNIKIFAGPYVGLLTNVNVKDVDDDGTVEDAEELDRDNFNTLDYGLIGGIGFGFDGGSFGIRYNYGLSEVSSEDSNSRDFVKDAKNSVIQLFIGFEL